MLCPNLFDGGHAIAYYMIVNAIETVKYLSLEKLFEVALVAILGIKPR